ncbi:hypothetical protein BS50DRAFT_319875 [Corynespora cassiicola Philippines]|uniref:Uncharacterized protein n=1 Tax=Corynespora cassiicola Philippines TaxID=1448308 RepID=A0A2T2NSZ3_CORCC|nr:hypothetical protein BS50DRAFT_319875 [Corynespora cassiicola Philippines]
MMHLVPLHLQDDYWELLRPVSTAGLPRPKEREGARIIFASLRLDSARPVGLESECSLGLEPKDTGTLFPTASHRSIVYVHSRSRPHFGDEKRTERTASRDGHKGALLRQCQLSYPSNPITLSANHVLHEEFLRHFTCTIGRSSQRLLACRCGIMCAGWNGYFRPMQLPG